MTVRPINIALFASGSGSNAREIMTYFHDHPSIRVVCLLSNKPNAGALQHAQAANIPSHVFTKEALKNGTVLQYLHHHAVDIIILAGFLWKIPLDMTKAYPDKILNIHPSLLPKYGGKGMYGLNVHKAVIQSGDKKSGITIHLVNEAYDKGRILAQYSVSVDAVDTPEILAQKIHQLEHRHYSVVIENYINQLRKT